MVAAANRKCQAWGYYRADGTFCMTHSGMARLCLLTDEWTDRWALTLTARLLGPLLDFTCERMRNVLFVLFCSKVIHNVWEDVFFGRATPDGAQG